MKIAIPLAAGKLSLHFGHCEKFVFIEADPETKKITDRTEAEPPPHEPGVLPRWLAEQQTNLIIAGGMGQRAQDLFQSQGIQVITGAAADTPENLVQSFLEGTLQTGANACDH